MGLPCKQARTSRWLVPRDHHTTGFRLNLKILDPFGMDSVCTVRGALFRPTHPTHGSCSSRSGVCGVAAPRGEGAMNVPGYASRHRNPHKLVAFSSTRPAMQSCVVDRRSLHQLDHTYDAVHEEIQSPTVPVGLSSTTQSVLCLRPKILVLPENNTVRFG